MQLLVNHQNMTPYLQDISSVRIEGQLSDPESKAYFTLDDIGSQIQLQSKQEVVIVDETIKLERITGTINVPAPVNDTFATNDLSSYTSTSESGGSVATWTYNGGSATITFDSAAGQKVSSGTTNTFSHTVASGQSNQILLVTVDAGATVSSVTYNGVALTQLGSKTVSGSEALSLWYLLAPAQGAHNVVITCASSTFIIGASTSYYNVAQTGTFGTLASNAGSGTSSTNTVTTTSSTQRVIDGVNNTAASTDTPTASQTKREQPTSSGVAVGDIAATGSNMTLTWSFSSSNWAQLSVAMNPATSTATVSASGGTNALLLRNNWTAQQATVSATLTTSDEGGIAFNVVDTSDYYEVVVCDASSPTPNTVTLYKVSSNTRTSLASASISFTRGTSHTIEAITALAGGALDITVLFDGTSVLTYTDTSPLGSGSVGLRNSTQSGASSSIYTAFSATSGDMPFSTTIDAAIPAHNYLNNNNFNYGGGGWTQLGSISGIITFPANPTYGSGAYATVTLSNNAIGNEVALQYIPSSYCIPGQSYCFSLELNITQAFVNGDALFQLTFFDITQANVLAQYKQTYTATTAGYQRVSIIGTAPTGAAYMQAAFGGETYATTNSGTAQFTALQLEPMWFVYTPNANSVPDYVKSYPTPICDFLQPDCATILDGTTVRFNRIFAGYISDLKATYHGPNRTWTVECTSLAGYMESDILINATYTNMLDQQIIYGQIGATAHFIAQTPSSIHVNGPDFASQNKVAIIPGQTIAATQYNDNTIREMFNDLQNYSGYVFGVDSYNNVFYQPQFYNKAPYAFSTSPDFVTTFPMYDYQLEIDASQIRNIIRVSGGTYQPTYTDTVVSGDGTHSQYYSGGVMDLFLTTYPGVTIPTVVANGTTLTVGGPGALYSQGYTALYNNGTSEVSLLNGVPTGQTVTATYQYNALVYVEVRDIGSIAQYGECWYKINDTSLVTLAAAQARGEAELAQYAQPRLVLTFKTQKMLTPGQVIEVTNPYDGLNAAKFTVQKVNVTWLGNNINQYEVTCGAYQPDLVDYVRNIHKALTRGKVNYNAIIQEYVTTSLGDSLTFSDSFRVH